MDVRIKMSSYKHLFFDLDHTLWDFDANCSETLQELHGVYGLEKYQIRLEDFIEKYKLINNRMWYDYNRGKISKEEIRDTRFELTFEELGVERSLTPPTLNKDFINICPTKANLFPFAHEVLSYLGQKYTLHIITNGFRETQDVKITTTKLDMYFQEIINSELCGYLKPDKRIFEYAILKNKAHARDCLMIGDDLYTDVHGARNAGLDQVFFNPKELEHEEEVTYEIKCLSELKKIL